MHGMNSAGCEYIKEFPANDLGIGFAAGGIFSWACVVFKLMSQLVLPLDLDELLFTVLVVESSSYCRGNFKSIVLILLFIRERPRGGGKLRGVENIP